MIRYRYGKSPRPEPVECNPRGYPHRDADGNVQYENTHFDTEAECWDTILRNAEAGVELGGMAVRERRKELAKAEAAFVNDTLHLLDVKKAHEEWQAAPPSAK